MQQAKQTNWSWGPKISLTSLNRKTRPILQLIFDAMTLQDTRYIIICSREPYLHVQMYIHASTMYIVGRITITLYVLRLYGFYCPTEIINF